MAESTNRTDSITVDELLGMAYSVAYVRVVASLVPRELEAIITPVTKRMSDAQLEAIIARGIEDGLDPAATD